MSNIEKAKKYFEHRFRELDGVKQTEEKLMFGIAYRAIREKLERNAPLTLAELQERVKQPIYIQYGDRGWWDIAADIDRVFLYTAYGEKLLIREYGTVWSAYRRKPEEPCQN